MGKSLVTTPAEKSAGGDNVVSIGIANQGTGYASAPSVSFSGGGGSSVGATAVLTDNKVTSFTVTNVGSSYTSCTDCWYCIRYCWN